MSKLQQLLGDLYKEDMTLEEVEKALATKKLIDKADFDKKASELAEANRKLKAMEDSTLSDQEKLENERIAREAELQALKAELAKSSAKSIFAESGLSESEIEPFLNLIATQDRDEAVKTAQGITNVLKTKQTALEKQLKEQLLKDTPKPEGKGGASDPVMTKELFEQLSFTKQVEFKQQNPQLFEEIMK